MRSILHHVAPASRTRPAGYKTDGWMCHEMSCDRGGGGMRWERRANTKLLFVWKPTRSRQHIFTHLNVAKPKARELIKKKCRESQADQKCVHWNRIASPQTVSKQTDSIERSNVSKPNWWTETSGINPTGGGQNAQSCHRSSLSGANQKNNICFR